MRILLVNDDGYDAPGINELRDRLLEDKHDVYMMAPSGNRSGASQSILISSALEVRKVGDRMYSCTGTPADCVMTALKGSVIPRPDIVLSGINKGANIGTDITYSGTCGAARQAVYEGIPSAALSIMIMKTESEEWWTKDDVFDYSAMADFAAKNLDNFRKMCVTADGILMPRDGCVFVNVNGVSCKAPYQGARFCGISFREYVNDKIELVEKPGVPDVFERKFSGGPSHVGSREYSDWDAAKNGFAAVSRIYAEPVSAGGLDGIEFRL